MGKTVRRSPEHQQAVLESRRSNATVPHKNLTKYNRNDKSWKKEI